MSIQVVQPQAAHRARSEQRRVAVVLGGMDLLQPLVRLGIPCVVVSSASDPVRRSLFAREWIPYDSTGGEDQLVARLLSWAQGSDRRGTLFYEHDEHLLAVARHAPALRKWFSFVCAEPALVEDLVDKSRFAQLADRLGLPVPTTLVCNPHDAPPEVAWPVVVKPIRRAPAWSEVERSGKAVECPDAASLHRLWPRLRGLGGSVLVQELVDGPESQIESYHTYVGPDGEVRGEFTGVKVRTWPPRYGYTTALEVRARPDVAGLGRAIVAKLGLTGVAKLDFKRRLDGSLALLEVNPRFNLWHNAGAASGCNLPGMVWSEVTGQPVPATAPADEVRWCDPLRDLRAARAHGVAWNDWLRWLRSCDVRSSFVARDPLPGAALVALSIRRRLPGRGR